jgi:hypothetical protein
VGWVQPHNLFVWAQNNWYPLISHQKWRRRGFRWNHCHDPQWTFIVLSEVKTTKPVKQILFFWLDSSILPIQPEPYPMIKIAIEMHHAHCFPYSPQAHSVLPCFSGVSTAAKPGGEWPVTKAAQVYTLVPRNPEPQVQPLQPGLCRVRSQTSGRYYYYHPCTGVSNWNPWWAAPWNAISVKRFAAYGWVLNHSLDVPSHFCWLNITDGPTHSQVSSFTGFRVIFWSQTLDSGLQSSGSVDAFHTN